MHVHISAPRPIAVRAIVMDSASITTLRERLVSLNDQAHSVMNRAQAAGREMTNAEAKEVNSLFEEFEATEAQITRIETLAAQEDRLGQPQGRVSPPADPAASNPIARGHGFAPGGGTSVAPVISATLERMRNDGGGFNNLGEFLRSVTGAARGHHDDRLKRMIWNASSTEGVGEDGGFLVPPMFVAEILEPALIYAGVVDRCRQIPLQGTNAVSIAGFGAETHSGGAVSNLQLYWEGEDDQLTSQKAKAKAISLRAKKGTVLVRASNELLTDSPAASQELGRIMSEALASGLEKSIIRGSGAGQPQGVVDGPATLVVAKESGQVADTVLYENLVKMMTRFHPAHLGNAVWVISQTVLSQLLSVFFPINDAVYGGTNGLVGGERIFNIDPAGGYSILGRPALVSEHAPTLGDKGDIILADFSQYFLAMVPMIGVEVSQHVWFDHDATALRIILRADGASRWSAPLTPATGDTVSPFVTLAERA